MKIYTYDEALQASLSYFNGEELPAKVFVDKYALRDNEGNILEKTPDDMHRRIAKEFARIEAKKFSEPLSEGDIFNLLKDFKYIVPQGSPMYGIGNPYQYVSLSNCFDKDTNVFTVNSGVKKICDISIGDKVITHKGTIENVEQIHKNKLSNRTVFKLKCFGTPEIKVTDNHKFLSISKEQLKWGEKPSWNTVEYLRSGDYIAIPKRNDVGVIKDINLSELFDNYLTYGDYSYIVNKNCDENKISLIYCYKPNHKKKHKEVNSYWKVDENFARFLGLWYGDGCIFSDSKIKDKIRGITFTFNSKEEEIIKFVSNYGSSLFGLIPDINDNTKIDGSTQIVFHSGIIGYTFDKLFGRGCNGKRLNNHIYSWPKKLVESLLIGLIESDGCVTSDGSTRVVLNNRNLIESFYHLLRSHGILACITHGLPPGDYSRLSFANNSYLKKFCKKTYFDDRLNYESKNKHKYSIEIDGVIYVKISGKEKIKYNEEYVYTLGISNTHSYNVEGLISLNCFVINSPADSYGGIHHTDEQLSHVSKRRGGIGIDISNLRPEGSPTKNSSRTSTGILSFMERYSNSIREVGQCIEENQMVLTKNGLKKIKHVNINDFVWTKNGFIKVINVFNNGIKDIYKITSKSGFSLLTSKEHVYQTYDNDGNLLENRLYDLDIDSDIVLSIGEYEKIDNNNYINLNFSEYKNINNKPENCTLPNVLNEELAYLLGYSYGDGYVIRTRDKNNIRGLELACSNDYKGIKDKLYKCINNSFTYKPSFTKGDGNLENLSINNKTIVEHLKYNLLLKEYSSDITFPELIIESPKSVQLAFISGYFDADGDCSGSKAGYRFRSINFKFLQNVQKILSSYGIYSKISKLKRKNKNWKDLYTLSITGKFSSEKFTKLLTKDSIKVNEKPYISKRDFTLTPLKSQNNKFLSLSDAKKQHILTTLVKDKVESIEFVGKANTYDLELESEHLFWCEGFYIHNSGRRGAMLLTLDVHHPQVLDFTTVKNDRTKVTGANISLRLSDEFLNAVQNDEDYELRFPVDSKTPKISKKTKAKEVWKAIIKNAHEMAEPGLVFWDTILRNSLPDCYAAFGFKTESLNPCQPGHTKILTESGIKNLSDINIGDYIWSKEGWTKVLNKWSNGIKDVYKYSTTAGCVYCTKNHRLVVDDKNTKVEAQYAKTINIFISETELKTFDIKSSEYSSTEEVFDITVDNKSNSYWSNGCDVSNCGEICLSIYDSCRLLLLNLYSYVDNPFTANAKFNYKKFLSHAIIAQRLMDNLIDLEIESIDRILNKIENDPEPLNIKQREIELWQNIKKYCELGRRTGTGITALGDAIAACGFKYDSDESLQTVEKIYKTLKFGCYLSSIEMAKELGPFPIFNYELEKDCEFLKRMEDESLIIDEDLTIYGKDILEAMKKYGRRNIALLTTSPAGTVSILTQTTSGIEPVFMTHYFRKKKGNLQDENFRCDFTDQNGDMWMEFPVYHPKLKEWMRITGETDITKSPYHGACANDINWRKRVELQALAGKHVDHSISSTINLPNNVSVEEVATIYETAWKTGTIKGITVYRDGCRTGVLTAEKSSEIKKSQEVIRPKALDCEVHHVTVKGTQYFVLLGVLDGKIYEVFAGKNGVLDKSIKNAKIVKKRGGHYHLVSAEDTKEIYLAPITVTCNEEEEAVTRLTSLLLRSGTELHEIVLQLEKVSGNISSFSKAIARVLKKHIPDDTIVKEKCPECGAESMVRQEGCVTCKNCGYSKC